MAVCLLLYERENDVILCPEQQCFPHSIYPMKYYIGPKIPYAVQSVLNKVKYSPSFHHIIPDYYMISDIIIMWPVIFYHCLNKHTLWKKQMNEGEGGGGGGGGG